MMLEADRSRDKMPSPRREFRLLPLAKLTPYPPRSCAGSPHLASAEPFGTEHATLLPAETGVVWPPHFGTVIETASA